MPPAVILSQISNLKSPIESLSPRRVAATEHSEADGHSQLKKMPDPLRFTRLRSLGPKGQYI